MAGRIGTVAFAVLVLSVSVAASRRAILSEAGGAQVTPPYFSWLKHLPAAHPNCFVSGFRTVSSAANWRNTE